MCGYHEGDLGKIERALEELEQEPPPPPKPPSEPWLAPEVAQELPAEASAPEIAAVPRVQVAAPVASLDSPYALAERIEADAFRLMELDPTGTLLRFAFQRAQQWSAPAEAWNAPLPPIGA